MNTYNTIKNKEIEICKASVKKRIKITDKYVFLKRSLNITKKNNFKKFFCIIRLFYGIICLYNICACTFFYILPKNFFFSSLFLKF